MYLEGAESFLNKNINDLFYIQHCIKYNTIVKYNNLIFFLL